MIKKANANKINLSPNIIRKTNLKSYFRSVTILLLMAICFILILNPKVYSNTCFYAISVWATTVFPALFPFFVLTKLIIGLLPLKQRKLDKLFLKIYHSPATSFNVFMLSCLSGYPMGAKLISYMYEEKIYSKDDAKKMLSFCSISGPMFMIGTVGVAFLKSYKAGIIIFLANIIACLINGLLYRGKSYLYKQCPTSYQQQKVSFADCVYDSIKSILTVGAYIVISFLLIEILNQLGVFNTLSAVLSNALHCNYYTCKSVLAGCVEITKGTLELSNLCVPLATKTCIASGLIGFGGLCIFMQSNSFLTNLHINKFYLLLQKITQGFFAYIISILLTQIFM